MELLNIRRPRLEDRPLIADFEDFCLAMYVLVDDLWARLGPRYRRPGPAPACSDSELITMVLVGECRGWDEETELIAAWQAYRALFPVIPERRRFNRRRRALQHAINDLRRVVLTRLDLAQDRQAVIDSLPVPVLHFHLVPSSPNTRTWRAAGAAFGKVCSKKQTIFGYKLHLLVTRGGVILDFVLAPANEHDLTVGAELLAEQRDRLVLGDKAYYSAPVAATLWAGAGVTLLALPRARQRVQLPPTVVALHTRCRPIIETVNEQLSEQLHVEANHATTFRGLCARLYSKLTAHTFCVYLNRLLGRPEYLQIKGLAFAN
jgi:IS5 family transposase